MWGISLLFIITVGVLVPQVDSQLGEQFILVVLRGRFRGSAPGAHVPPLPSESKLTCHCINSPYSKKIGAYYPGRTYETVR